MAPDNHTGLINLAVQLEGRGQFEKAEPLYRRSLAIDTTTFQSSAGLARVLGAEGRLDEMAQVIAVAQRRMPRSKWTFDLEGSQAYAAAGRTDSAARLISDAAASTTVPMERANIAWAQGAMVAAQGHLAEADRQSDAAMTLARQGAAPGLSLAVALDPVIRTSWYRGDRAAAARKLDEALKTVPLSSITPIDRPFAALVNAQLSVGRIDAAKATLADYLKAANAMGVTPDTNVRSHMEGAIALAERKFDLAATRFRERSVDMDFDCLTVCELPLLAQAYDQGGKPDSAIAVYERYLTTKTRGRAFVDAQYLGPSLKRLGELYEAKGDRENAAKRYAEFVALWKTADPELQPTVKDVQARLGRLRTSEPLRQVTPKR